MLLLTNLFLKTVLMLSFSGAKLCMISDLLGDSGSVTGVDIARHRLAACRTMLQKYALGNRCRLFVANGTSFSIVPVRENLHSKSRKHFGHWKVDCCILNKLKNLTFPF